MINTNKILAAAIATASVFSFAGSFPVQAETVFPPAHLAENARFAESTVIDQLPAGSYYRPADQVALELDLTPGQQLADNVQALPWYQAAN